MSAPMQGDVLPHTYRFRLGAFEVTTILDGTDLRDSVHPPFCLDMCDEDLRSLARRNRLPADRLEHPFVPTLVNTGAELVLFDVGFGEAGAGHGVGRLVERMRAAGYAPEDVDLVAFSHCHADHILGVTTDGAPTFPNARYVIGRVEFDEWRGGTRLPESRAENRRIFLERVVPLAERMTFLEDGDAVARGITAEAAFGHSPGHMTFRIESGSQQALLWGDLVNHYVFSLQVPGQRVRFDDNPEGAAATRRRVLDMAATDDLPIIGYHMPFPGLGYVERDGEGFRWMPASYQMRV